MKKRVLFLCTGNSARSQMAEAFLRKFGAGKYEAHSAGTHPKGLHPLTVQVMTEAGIDVGQQRSKDVGGLSGQQFDHVITVCDSARQECPVFPGTTSEHWSLPDPADAKGGDQDRLQLFRRVRDEISQRVRLFVERE